MGFIKKFQSAPLTDVRGDLMDGDTAFDAELFQSAPLTDVRGDVGQRRGRYVGACFNPLPSLM